MSKALHYFSNYWSIPVAVIYAIGILLHDNSGSSTAELAYSWLNVGLFLIYGVTKVLRDFVPLAKRTYYFVTVCTFFTFGTLLTITAHLAGKPDQYLVFGGIVIGISLAGFVHVAHEYIDIKNKDTQ